jgi:hypothetical protein
LQAVQRQFASLGFEFSNRLTSSGGHYLENVQVKAES